MSLRSRQHHSTYLSDINIGKKSGNRFMSRRTYILAFEERVAAPKQYQWFSTEFSGQDQKHMRYWRFLTVVFRKIIYRQSHSAIDEPISRFLSDILRQIETLSGAAFWRFTQNISKFRLFGTRTFWCDFEFCS